MSQPYRSSSHLKRPNDGESRADKSKRQVTFTGVNTPISGTSEDPVSGTPDTPVSGTFEDPVSGAADTPVSGTFEAPVSGTSKAPVSGISEAPVSGTANTHGHEDPSHSSSSSPIIPTQILPVSLIRKRSEIFPTPLEGDTSYNMSKPATLQNTSRPRGFARRAKPFTPRYPGPSRLELKNTTTVRNQSCYDLSDSKSDESSSDEDDDSDKENKNPEAPQPNKDVKESGVHPCQLMSDTGSGEPSGSSSTYRDSTFMSQFDRDRQELYNKIAQGNGYSTPFDNRPPFPGTNMQFQQDSNGPLHDHVQEESEDSEGSEDQNGYEKSMTDTMKAITRQNVVLQSSAFASRENFMDESRDWDERELFRKEANSLEEKIYNNRILLLSYSKAMNGDVTFQK
ncbi:hypothetical protein BGZ90_007101 [Linnemannia elongata]|nr:hypothetical protein BGZ90_007101 [Linnemannia elongata]